MLSYSMSAFLPKRALLPHETINGLADCKFNLMERLWAPLSSILFGNFTAKFHQVKVSQKDQHHLQAEMQSRF